MTEILQILYAKALKDTNYIAPRIEDYRYYRLKNFKSQSQKAKMICNQKRKKMRKYYRKMYESLLLDPAKVLT